MFELFVVFVMDGPLDADGLRPVREYSSLYRTADECLAARDEWYEHMDLQPAGWSDDWYVLGAECWKSDQPPTFIEMPPQATSHS